jgi:hypothetical protein
LPAVYKDELRYFPNRAKKLDNFQIGRNYFGPFHFGNFQIGRKSWIISKSGETISGQSISVISKSGKSTAGDSAFFREQLLKTVPGAFPMLRAVLSKDLRCLRSWWQKTPQKIKKYMPVQSSCVH